MESAALRISLILTFFLSTSVFGCSHKVMPLSSSSSQGISDNYPWHSALYRNDRESSNPEYVCGGTLVDHNKVVTAAFCVADWHSDPMSAENLFVILGKTNTDWNTTDPYQQKFKVDKIIIHEGYHGPTNKYENAIAVIVLKENVTINNHVSPACLDLKTPADTIRNGTLLYMVGWGRDNETGLPRLNLREAPLSYIDRSSCQDMAQLFKPYVTPDKFCVLPSSGGSPEVGDSGQGVTIERGHQLIVIGIISIKPTGGNITAITAISYFASWLKDILIKY